MHDESLPLSAAPAVAHSGLFPATMWSMVLAAKDQEEALGALDRLARAYWRPLYVFVRQRGSDHDAAADAVQGFFQHLLSHEMLRNVERGEVRFRSFLLRCFSNWLANEHEKARAAKRGGGARALDVHGLGSRVDDPALIEGESPDHAFDRNWARAMVDQAMAELDRELATRERRVFLEELRRKTFATDGQTPDWEEVASRHGMTHGAVRKASTDLRRRFGALLREEVRKVVSSDDEVEEELRYLVGLLSAA